MAKRTLKILWCKNRKIFEVYLAIFRSILREYKIFRNKTTLLRDSKYNEKFTTF